MGVQRGRIKCIISYCLRASLDNNDVLGLLRGQRKKTTKKNPRICASRSSPGGEKPASPKRGGAGLEDLHFSCGRTVYEGESLETIADRATLDNRLSSSALECPAEKMDFEAGDRPTLYRALDALRVTPAPLGKSPPPSLGHPGNTPVLEADSTPRSPSRQAQLSAAAVTGGLSGPRLVLWVCAASTLLFFAAAMATVAALIANGSDELSRSLDEVQRVLKVNGAVIRAAMLSPTGTDPRLENRTAPLGGEARDAARINLNATGSASRRS
ncbi:uncharacterized protein LOC144129982 [Amblyomma americanum]